jgi:hypothetical protein
MALSYQRFMSRGVSLKATGGAIVEGRRCRRINDLRSKNQILLLFNLPIGGERTAAGGSVGNNGVGVSLAKDHAGLLQRR